MEAIEIVRLIAVVSFALLPVFVKLEEAVADRIWKFKNEKAEEAVDNVRDDIARLAAAFKDTGGNAALGASLQTVSEKNELTARACPNCGAPVRGSVCEYCGSIF